MAALGWIDLAITAVSTGISLFQGFKAKKKQKEALKRAEEEAERKRAEALWKAKEQWRSEMYQLLHEQKQEDAVEAQKQGIIKIVSFTAAGVSAYLLIKMLRNRGNSKKTKKK